MEADELHPREPVHSSSGCTLNAHSANTATWPLPGRSTGRSAALRGLHCTESRLVGTPQTTPKCATRGFRQLLRQHRGVSASLSYLFTSSDIQTRSSHAQTPHTDPAHQKPQHSSRGKPRHPLKQPNGNPGSKQPPQQRGRPTAQARSSRISSAGRANGHYLPQPTRGPPPPTGPAGQPTAPQAPQAGAPPQSSQRRQSIEPREGSSLTRTATDLCAQLAATGAAERPGTQQMILIK